jgi:lipopolysaccharide/colanic/teichoic acid biosynthesis glycosyltransferase
MNVPIGGGGYARSYSGIALRQTRSGNIGKRAMDLAFCVLASPFALLLGIPIGVILKIGGGSVVYAQLRVGRHGNQFPCLKFRSMVCNADSRLQQVLESSAEARTEWARFQKLTKDPRVTWFGKMLRAFSLDELPQLVNVWRGEMSIVGPRPITPDQIELYGEYFPAYCTMKPGITGLWQVSGRNNRTFDERVKLDTRYAKTHSLLGDLVIIVRTLPVVLSGSAK